MAQPKSQSPTDILDVVDTHFAIRRGKPYPLGATLQRGGINFAIFSKKATHFTLVLFGSGESTPLAEFPMDPRFNRTGDIWHALIIGLDPGIEYAYRADCVPNDNPEIDRFDPAVILVDPYARAISGREKWGEAVVGQCEESNQRLRKGLVVENDFDWGEDQPLGIPMADSIFYEMHVRGFTRHDSSGVARPGTFIGLTEKIDYLKDLGITAVELLPVAEFEEGDTDKINPNTGERLLNLWGYNSIGFFAPNASYATDPKSGHQVHEFKQMVKEFHRAGIEIILDVVFNHTAEGDRRGPTLSFKGLGNQTYYMIDPDTGAYSNYSGCGNTLNCNHPVVRKMIIDCLRYWVTEMHVDGFRFDLASILGRGRDGSVLASPPLLEGIACDPILGNTKLIAEAWDAAGLYQVGSFPAYGRWAEWNAHYRDDTRRFVKGEPGLVHSMSQRMLGSPDVYAWTDRAPTHSINFVTCHDGFTLADMVSYNQKHNSANGEDNRDGMNDNNSWNCGWEGSTILRSVDYGFECRLHKIDELRRQMQKNHLALLLLSRGVPMILAGDEFGRTQKGNNNAYCQDNEISWIDWNQTESNADLLRFVKLLVDFRKRHPALRCESYAELDQPGDYRVIFHGVEPGKPDYSRHSHSLAVQFEQRPEKSSIYVAINSWWKPLDFILPRLSDDRRYFVKLDTSLSSGDDICQKDTARLLANQTTYQVAPRSIVVLLGT